jgi:hypothetical protein
LPALAVLLLASFANANTYAGECQKKMFLCNPVFFFRHGKGCAPERLVLGHEILLFSRALAIAQE